MAKARTTRPQGAHAPAPSALTAATRLLAARPRSRAALTRMLEARGFTAAEAQSAAERCESLGYLREADFARALATELLKAGHAPDAVVARIVAKELPEATARAAVDAEVKELGWDAAQAARALLAKKRLSGARAVRFLLARGFEEDVARRAAGFDEM